MPWKTLLYIELKKSLQPQLNSLTCYDVDTFEWISGDTEQRQMEPRFSPLLAPVQVCIYYVLWSSRRKSHWQLNSWLLYSPACVNASIIDAKIDFCYRQEKAVVCMAFTHRLYLWAVAVASGLSLEGDSVHVEIASWYCVAFPTNRYLEQLEIL